MPNGTSYDISGELTGLEDLLKKRQTTASSSDVLNMLRETLVSKYSKESPLIKQRQEAEQALLSAPEEALAKYSAPQTVTIGEGTPYEKTLTDVLYSPTQIRALRAGHIAAKQAPFTTLNDLLAMRMGGIENIIGGVGETLKEQRESRREEFDIRKAIADLKIRAGETGREKGTVVQTADEVLLVDPYTGETIKSLGKPKTSNVQSQIAVIAGEDLIRQIGDPTLQNARRKTGTPEANSTYTKLKVPFFGGLIMSKEDKELANLDQKYFLLTRTIMTIIEGKRPSDADARAYQQRSGPSILMPDEVNQDRIATLLSEVEAMSGQSTEDEWEDITNTLTP